MFSPKVEPLQDEFLLEDSDQEYDSGPSTPGTPISAAVSPRKGSKSRVKDLPCPYDGCDKSFNRPAKLEEHKRSHTNERIFKCKESGCTKDFLRKTHLERHVESAHTEGPKSFPCQYEECDKSFTTNQRLKRHYEFHEKRDKYRCTEQGCEQTFRKHSTRDQHIRTTHRGEAAFPCEKLLDDGTPCTRQFTNANGLNLHIGRDHGAKRYFCTSCPEDSNTAFGTFSELQAHDKAIHPPTCEECGFISKSTKNLAYHMQSKHSGDTLFSRQTYICTFPECNSQGFVSKRNLQIHVQSIHEQKRLYKCGDISLSLNHIEGWDTTTACGRDFRVKATLEQHIRVRHMGLETTQKSILKRRADRLADGEAQQSKRRNTQTSKRDLLTGTSMTDDTRRTIPCSVRGCKYTFIREWDRQVHLQSRHGILLEDDWIMTSSVLDRENDDHDDEQEGDYQADADWTGTTYSTSEYLPVAQLFGTKRVDHQGPLERGPTEEELEESARHGGPFWIGQLGDQQDGGQFDPLHDGYGFFAAGNSEVDEYRSPY